MLSTESFLWLPAVAHPWAGLVGLGLGWWLGGPLASCSERFAYDDEEFDPRKGPREREKIYLSELEDLSHLPPAEKVPFLGPLWGMLLYCRFHLLLATPTCNDCGGEIPSEDQTPVLSYLRLGGRCRACHAAIPTDLYWVEVLMPLLFAAVLGVHGLGLPGLLLCLLAALCLIASVVDQAYQIIPDEVSAVGAAVGLGSGLGHSLGALLTSGPLPATLTQLATSPALMDPWHLGWAVGGALAGGLPLWVLLIFGSFLAGTDAMGYGDVKLAVALGPFLGPVGTLMALFWAAILGAAAGMILLLRGGGKREGGFTKFAFGPYICAGALIVALIGPETMSERYAAFNQDLVDWYLGVR